MLSSNPENLLDVTDLTRGIALRQPPDLPLADHVHRLITGDGPQGTLHRSEPLTGRHSSLKESVILLQHIVQIRRWSAPAATTQLATRLQLPDCLWISRMPVHMDHRGRSPPTRHSAICRKCLAAPSSVQQRGRTFRRLSRSGSECGCPDEFAWEAQERNGVPIGQLWNDPRPVRARPSIPPGQVKVRQYRKYHRTHNTIT